MGPEKTRRKIAFVLAAATLAAGALAMAALDRGEGRAVNTAPDPQPGRAQAPSRVLPARGRGAQMREAASSAHRFLAAYLRYQEGHLNSAGRASLLRYATTDLGRQLVRAPVRVPPGSRAPRQFVARVAAVRVGLFASRPALLVAVVVAGRSGTHLLSTSLIETGRGWVVAGVGP
ncbi:MAG TPA: hypothetical protein VF245_00500 [Solirubrobacterales bacterium]